jgi:DNA-binding transcriptional MerR regulator
LRRISALVDAGVNLAGIARILSLEDDNAELSAANSDLRSANRTLKGAAKQTAAADNSKTSARKSMPRKV